MKLCAIISAQAIFDCSDIGRPAAAAGVADSEFESWQSPVDHEDVMGVWDNETYAYDENTANYAEALEDDEALILYLNAPAVCNGLAVYSSIIVGDPFPWYADIYDMTAAQWVRVVEDENHTQSGSPTLLEAFFPAAKIDKVRIYSGYSGYQFRLHEVYAGLACEMGGDVSGGALFGGSLARKECAV